jgi:hypothetical protein
MATSSDFSTSNQYIKYRIIVDELSTSIPNNTSSVRVKVQAWRTNTGYTTYGSGTCYVTCNGNNASSGITSSQSFSYNSYTEVFNQTFTIPHNADGTKTIYVSSYISHDRFSSSSQGFNVTLSTIPRASTVSSISGNTIGSNVVVNIIRASNSFTHSVVMKFGNQTATVSSATTSATFTPPMSWCSQIPTSTSGTATITVTTYNGSTSIGTSSTTCTINVPSSVKPSVPTLDSRSDPTGVYKAMGNQYVQSKSKLKGTINASGSYGSTITGYKAVVNGTTYTSQTFTTGLLSTSGQNTCKITVTDSRGRTNTADINFTVVAYTAPKITTFTVERDDDNPANAEVIMAGSITSLNNRNTKTYTLKYKQQGASSYTSISLDNSTYTLNDTRTITISEDHSYTFLLEVKDYFTTTPSQRDIGTAFQLENWNANGTGMAIGGVYDETTGGVLQINGATTIKGATTITGNLNAPNYNGYELDFSTKNTSDTWVLVLNGGKIQHRVINSALNEKGVLNLSNVGAVGWVNQADGESYLVNKAFMAFWSGAYSGTSSNLRYCYKGLIRQNNTAYLNYGRKTYSSGTAWSNFSLSNGQNSATTGSGMIVGGNQIKINTTAINRVLVTASVEGFKNGSGTSDNSFSVLVSYNNFRRNILYTSVPNTNWHNGGSITFPVTVANGTTIKIQGSSGLANASIEVLNADLFVQDITV